MAPEETSDLLLLQRIVARDESALAELYDRYSRLAYSVIRHILRSTPEADDVLQETFMRVWSRAETYDARLGSPATWVARIARNRAIDRLRTLTARQRLDTAASEAAAPGAALPEQPANAATPETILDGAMMAGVVRGALAALPDAQRVLIESAFFEGYTHQELAARYGVPLGTVKTRIRSGLLTLRGHLEHAV